MFLAVSCLLPQISLGEISGKINLNTATVKELKKLPFVGAAKAKAIVKYRQKNGPYSSIDTLRDLPVIGESTLEAITPYLVLTGQTTIQRQEKNRLSGGSVFARINTSQGQIIQLPNGDYYPAIMAYIQHAKSDINITMFIFKITKSPKNKALLLLKELIAAKRRGVDISVTLDKSGYDPGINRENKRTAKKLRKNGIKVRFDSEKRTTHSKMVVVDHRFCFIGSHNFTHSALSYNNEYSLLIDSVTLAQDLEQYIAKIQ